MAKPGPPTGSHMGKVLHDLNVQARVNAAGIIGPIVEQARDDARTAFMERAEEHFTPVVRALLAEMMDGDNLPPGLRDVFVQAGGPDAQFDWLLQLIITAVGIFFNAGPIFAPAVKKYENQAWTQHQDLFLDPEAAATAVLKGHLLPTDGAAEAATSGLNLSRFLTLVDTIGNPPPLEAGAEAVRRGFMDLARFEKLVQESRYRLEWIDIFEKLLYGPPSPAVAVQAAVQGHLDPATAQSIVGQGGIDPANYQWLYDTAGRPPGVQEIIALVRRGVATTADIATAVQESDIKNKYIPLIEQMVVHIPPMRSITQMIHKGVMDAATGTRYLAMLGFEPQIVSNLVAEAQAQSTAAHKGETESLIVDSYKAGLIDGPTASAHLTSIGYDASAIPMILALADHQVAAAFTNKALTRIGTLYVAGKIDRPTASSDLSTLGVGATAATRYLATWDLERATIVKRLTVVQLGYGVKQGALTAQQMHDELVIDGYSDRDAGILVTHYG